MKNIPVKILIVDDEEGNINVLRLTFGEKYRVLLARDGREGMEILENREEHRDIKVIITDQRMPHMSGVELLERSLETHPQALRIIVTGYPDLNGLKQRLERIHIHKIYFKPLTDQRIEEMIRYIVENTNK
jgi:response regulator RpfG family c-di-GMP phosphodiesterase